MRELELTPPFLPSLSPPLKRFSPCSSTVILYATSKSLLSRNKHRVQERRCRRSASRFFFSLFVLSSLPLTPLALFRAAYRSVRSLNFAGNEQKCQKEGKIVDGEPKIELSIDGNETRRARARLVLAPLLLESSIACSSVVYISSASTRIYLLLLPFVSASCSFPALALPLLSLPSALSPLALFLSRSFARSPEFES